MVFEESHTTSLVRQMVELCTICSLERGRCKKAGKRRIKNNGWQRTAYARRSDHMEKGGEKQREGSSP